MQSRWGEEIGRGCVRIWELPQRGKRYRIGVDGSGGKKGSDWQNAYMIDDMGDHIATIRSRLPVMAFAGEVQRLGLWFGVADIHVEMQEHGALIYSHLRSHVSELEISLRGAHRCLMRPYPGLHLHERKKTKPNRIARQQAFRSWLLEVEIKDPELYQEMLTLDPWTNEARGKSDTDDYLDSAGIAYHEHEQAAARPAPEALSVSVRKRRR